MKKRRNQLILSLLRKKKILIMIKMLLNLNNQEYKKKTSKILIWLNSLRACKSKTNEENFSKKVIEWLFDDCGIVPNEKKNL